MIIKNAEIKNVTAGMDSEKNVCVSMEFHYSTHFKVFVFTLENPVELKNFTKLMEFAEVKETKEMEDKIIRVAVYGDVILAAVGHPIEDRFIDVTNTMISHVEEVKESDLIKEYPETK